jgi:hypothetical protein
VLQSDSDKVLPAKALFDLRVELCSALGWHTAAAKLTKQRPRAFPPALERF